MSSQTLRVLDLLNQGKLSVDETITILRSIGRKNDYDCSLICDGLKQKNYRFDNPDAAIAPSIIEPLQ